MTYGDDDVLPDLTLEGGTLEDDNAVLPDITGELPADEDPLSPLVPETGTDAKEREFKFRFQTALERLGSGDVDRAVEIERFATEARLPIGAIEGDFEGIKASWQASQRDAHKWSLENPILAKKLLEVSPDMGTKVVETEGPFKTFLRKLQATSAAFESVDAGLGPIDLLRAAFGDEEVIRGHEEKLAKSKAAAEGVGAALTAEPKKNEAYLSPAASGSTLQKGVAKFSDTVDDQALSLLYARKAAGLGSPELDREIQEKEIHSFPRAYGASAGEDFFVETMGLLPSVLSSALPAVIAGGATMMFTGNEKAAKGVGTVAGGIAAFPLELGSSYRDFSRTMDDGLARTMAFLYAGAASGIEAFVGNELDFAGSLGQLIKAGNREAFAKAVLGSKTGRRALAELGLKLHKNALGESMEELAQNGTQFSVGWLGESIQAGEAQEFDAAELAIQSIDTFVSTYQGSLGVAAGGHSLGALATRGARKEIVSDEARRQASEVGAGKVKAVLEFANDSETVKVAPQLMADLVAEATAQGGDPVTAFHVDPVDIETFFQKTGADPKELLGEDGLRKLAEAKLAGERFEVPVATYFDKWVGHEIHGALDGRITVRPDHLSEKQIEEDDTAFAEEVKKLSAEFEKNEGTAPEGTPTERAFFNRMRSGLERSKTYDKAQAKKAVALNKAVFSTLAKRSGKTVEELIRRFKISVTSEGRVKKAARAEPLVVEDSDVDLLDEELEATAQEAEPAEVEDDSFDFGENVTKPRRVVDVEAFSKAQALIARMADPENKNQATAFLNWVQQGGSVSDEATANRPIIKNKEIEKRLFALGFSDPTGKYVPDFALYDPTVQALQNSARRNSKRGRLNRRVKKAGQKAERYDQAATRRKRRKPLATNTETFKAWFGESKVATKVEPTRVYHGSKHAGFDQFKKEFQDPNGLYGPGFYFTEDPGVAGDYTDKGGRLVQEAGETPGVYPVYLSIKNPIDADKPAKEFVEQLRRFRAKTPPPTVKRMIDSAIREESTNFSVEGLGAWADNTEWAYNILDREGKNGEEFFAPYFDYVVERARDYMVREIQARRWGKGDDIIGFIKRNIFSIHDSSKGDSNVQEVLRMLGFDGIAHVGGDRMGGGHHHQVWIAFDPEQVKSAVGNDGSFDADDPSILSQATRGWVEMMKTAAGRAYKIFLTKDANLSTFLHESAHVYLDMLQELSADADAPQGLKELNATALEWLGAKEGEKLTVEQHEKWARTFEKYLLEGNAPSDKVARIFDAFKNWLTGIYRTLRDLDGVEVSEEIRGVFDRLVATDEEIADASHDMGLQPLFRSPDEAGMGPEEWAGYLEAQEKARSTTEARARLRSMKDRKREVERWWKTERKSHFDQALKDFEMRQDVRALNFLKTGIMVFEDGTRVQIGDAGKPQKLDRDAVKRMLGDRFGELKRLTKDPETGKPTELDEVFGESVDEGLNPDEVAERFKFPTGKEMLETLLSIPNGKEWANAEADARMSAAHPSILEERQKLRETVEKGLAGDHAEKWLVAELSALRKKLGVEGPPVNRIEAAAKLSVANGEVRRLEVARAQQAMANSSRKALEATAKGNFEQALIHHHQHLWNFYRMREVQVAREERNEFQELASDLKKHKSRERLGKASPIYRDGVDGILELLGLREELRRDKPLASLGEVVHQMELDGQTIAFDPQALEETLKEPRDWKDLTVNEMREVVTALKSIRQAARNKTTALVDGKRQDKEAVEAALIEEAVRNESVKGSEPSSESAATILQALNNGWTWFDGSLLKIETMVGWLGGRDTGSMWHRAVIQPLQDAKAKEVEILNETVRPVLDAFEKMPKSLRSSLFDNVDGRRLFPTHAIKYRENIPPPTKVFEILMMALNMGNESNIHRLTEGRNITVDQVVAAIDETLSKETLEWVQTVWDACESLWPAARDLEERDSGVAPGKIPSRKLVTKWGTFKGGYFPAIYDRRGENAGEVQVANALASFQDPTFTRPTTSHSHLKGRVENFSGMISLEPNNIPRHLSQVAHDLAYREAIKSVGGLLLSPRIQATLKERLGDNRASQFVPWVKDVGQMRGLEGYEKTGAMMNVMRKLKGNTVIAALGYAVPNMLEDATNIVAAIPRANIKTRHMAGALSEYMRSPSAVDALAHAKSGELQTRRKQLNRELQSQMRKITARGGIPREAFDFVKDNAFVLMEFSDRVTSTTVWLAAYRQASRDMGEAEAVRWADAAVRKVFPSHSAVDLAPALRDKGFIGTTLTFYGFLNTYYNGLRDMGHEFAKKSGGDRAVVAGRILGYAVAVSVLAEFIRGRGREGDEEWAEWFARKMLAGSLSALPYGGDLANAIEGAVLGKRTNPRASSNLFGPVVGLVEAFRRKDAASAVASSVGSTFGLPVGQARKTGRYLFEASTGERQPENVFDFLGGVTYGERDGQPENAASLLGDQLKTGGAD